MIYQETVATIVTFTKTTESKIRHKKAILPFHPVFKCLFVVGSCKDVKVIQGELNTLATIQPRHRSVLKGRGTQNRYEINKMMSATKYIVNMLKELNHIVLGVFPLTDFFIVYA